MNTDVLKVIGINSKGYGNIPKLVMQDRNLTIEAKAIYAYFASYAGAGTNAFPGRSKILYDLGISESRYYRHFKLLTDAGYITVEQIRNVNKWAHNLYILNAEVVPCPQNEGTKKVTLLHPQNEGTQNEGTQNKGTNTNSSKKNNINKRNSIKKLKKGNATPPKKGKYDDFYL